jgi:hypothetical protein
MNRLTCLLIAAGIGFSAGAGSAYKLTADHYSAAAAKEQQDAAEAYQAKAEELNQVSADLERARHDRKVVYRTITQQVERIVTRDVYRNQCVDSDGVSIINAALAGKPVNPAQLDAAMPAAGAAAGNDGR